MSTMDKIPKDLIWMEVSFKTEAFVQERLYQPLLNDKDGLLSYNTLCISFDCASLLNVHLVKCVTPYTHTCMYVLARTCVYLCGWVSCSRDQTGGGTSWAGWLSVFTVTC
jgi:hypothetical protein